MITDVIDSGTATFGIYAQHPQPAVAALSDIRSLARRALSHRNNGYEIAELIPGDLLSVCRTALERHPATQRSHLTRHAPLDSAITAAGVVAAMVGLNQADIDAAIPVLRRPFAQARQGYRRHKITADALTDRGSISPVLTAAQFLAAEPWLSPTVRLRHRVTTPWPILPTAGIDDVRDRIRSMPTLLWPAWSLPMTVHGLHPRFVRAALPAALLIIGTRLSPTEAIESFNSRITSGRGVTYLLYSYSRSDRNGGTSATIALQRMADHLDGGAVPIDYQRRRELDYSGLLPDEVWSRICRVTGASGSHPGRALVARRYLYETLSGRLVSDATPAIAPSVQTSASDFPEYLTPEIAAALDEHAAEFLAARGIDDEPVSWTPPTDLLLDLRLPGPDPAAIDVGQLHGLTSSHRRAAVTAVAAALDTSLEMVRYLLQCHPAPLDQPGVKKRNRKANAGYRQARAALSKEEFLSLYVQQRLTMVQIANRIGVHRNSLKRLALDYEIPLRGMGRVTQFDIERDWLFEQYVVRARTMPDIAREIGSSSSVVSKWLKEYGIPTRIGTTSHRAVLDALTQARAAPSILLPAVQGPRAWDHLREFEVTTEHPTIDTVVETLGVTRTSLFQTIVKLEHRLGGELLEREGRVPTTKPTPFGKEVLAALVAHREQGVPRVPHANPGPRGANDGVSG
ncbi:LysR family transcriptional regulator [Nocardia sp. NPDC056611]|uniref:helix-turn-helix domain-containing protein n=1 Tax=Nocardia sp. NPDC056611 TaxID=3345877 RepID=UPI00366FB55E